MIFLKLLTLGFGLLIVWQVYKLWQTGRQLHAERQQGGRHRSESIQRHTTHVVWFGLLAVLTVLLIELQGALSAEPYTLSSKLFVFHLLVDGLILVLFGAIVLWYRGTHDPEIHHRFVYLLFFLFAVASATGLVLLYELPGPA